MEDFWLLFKYSHWGRLFNEKVRFPMHAIEYSVTFGCCFMFGYNNNSCSGTFALQA